MAKSVTIILLVLCGMLCTAYSAPVSTQKYANMKEVLNQLKQQSSSRTKASEQVLAQAMKLAAAQMGFLPGPCPVGAFCSTSKQQSSSRAAAEEALSRAVKQAAAQFLPCPQTTRPLPPLLLC